MSKISYRCLPEERSLPLAERTHWDVRYGGTRIGFIRIKNNHILTQNRSHSVRVWNAYLISGFNAFEFPHAEDGEVVDEPYVATNNDKTVEHNLELRNPQLMTMLEARTWVANTYRSK